LDWLRQVNTSETTSLAGIKGWAALLPLVAGGGNENSPITGGVAAQDSIALFDQDLLHFQDVQAWDSW
jgi:hypothetical protein